MSHDVDAEGYARVAELIKARRSGKLPADWLMDSDSAQQATPLVLAQYRRRFLQGLGVELVHDVTCSIGTEGHAWNKGTYIGAEEGVVHVVLGHFDAGELIDLFDQVDWEADGARLICHAAGDGLANPPRCVGGLWVTVGKGT